MVESAVPASCLRRRNHFAWLTHPADAPCLTGDCDYAELEAIISSILLAIRSEMPIEPRLDRQSALLQGMQPRVVVAPLSASPSAVTVSAASAPFLHRYLLTRGRICLRVARGARVTVDAPAIVVCHAATARWIEPASAGAAEFLVCARAYFDGPVASLLRGEFDEVHTVSLEQTDSSLHHVVKLTSAELLVPRCGQPALLDKAGDILFVGLPRHLIAHPKARGAPSVVWPTLDLHVRWRPSTPDPTRAGRLKG